jgi:hypothetical protein
MPVKIGAINGLCEKSTVFRQFLSHKSINQAPDCGTVELCFWRRGVDLHAKVFNCPLRIRHSRNFFQRSNQH